MFRQHPSECLRFLSRHVSYRSLLIGQHTVTPLAFSPPPLVIILNNWDLKLGLTTHTSLHTLSKTTLVQKKRPASHRSLSLFSILTCWAAKWESYHKETSQHKITIHWCRWCCCNGTPRSTGTAKVLLPGTRSFFSSSPCPPQAQTISPAHIHILTVILWYCHLQTRNSQTSMLSSLLV